MRTFSGRGRAGNQGLPHRLCQRAQDTALSNRPSNLRGKQGRVIIDEAAFVEDLPELLKAALALLMWGGQVIIISTHDGAENPFNELIQDVRAGNLPYSLHRITLDDALSAGLYRRICRVTKQDWTPEAEEAWRADLIKTYGDARTKSFSAFPVNRREPI